MKSKAKKVKVKVKKTVAKKTAGRKKVVAKKVSAKKKSPARQTGSKKAPRKKATVKKRATAKKKAPIKKKPAAKKKKVTARKKPAAKRATTLPAARTKKPPTPKKSPPMKVAAKSTAPAKKTTPKKKTAATRAAARKTHPALADGASSVAPFTPYKEARGEEYMNDNQVEHFRDILLGWKHQLMEEVDRTLHHMQDEAANFPDPNDRATQESEFTLELRTRDRERKLIKKIDEAVITLDTGDYGFCETCGVEIGVRRLEARPTATLCIDCKVLDEIRERQMG